MGNLRSIIIVFILTACGIFIAGNAKAQTLAHATDTTDHIWDFRPTRVDHQLHMSVSYALTYTFTDIFEQNGAAQPELMAVLLVSSLGLAKECFDHSKYRGFSFSDLTANAVGITSATLIHYHLRY